MNTVLSARIRRLLAGSALLLPLLHAHPAYPGDRFICAGVPPLDTLSEGAAKVAAGRVKEGSPTAIVIFAKFKGEDSELVSPPSWAQDMFDPERPGSITHFYQTMSFGKLNIDGAVAPKYYESEHEASWYLSDDPTKVGKFGVFTLDILEQADEDLDFSQYNNDGPDGIPNSPDDDALVDALFMMVRDIPPNFLLGPATGISNLGFQDSYETNDLRRLGRRTRIHTRLGVLNQANTYAEATGTICHEYGHILGLPDLFNLAYVKQGGGPPATDSAGIGAWGVMGWGALGWHPGYGPSSLSAWSRLELGWGTVTKAIQLNEIMELEDVALNGQMYEIRFPFRERFLIENRQRKNNYYDRGIPGEGLLIWHIDPSRSVTAVDLECADGRWRDAGFPLGSQPDLTEGEDNLDFWAHDAAYSESRRGNFGDSTDPYDGVRYTSFSETTNPGSHSNNGKWSVRLDDITIDAAGKATAKVTAVPPVVVKGFNLGDTNSDSVIVAGELVALGWTVEGHRRVLNNFFRVTISTEDPLVEIVRPSSTRRDLGRMFRTYGDTVVWAEVPASATRWALPQLRFTNSADVFAGTHSATVWMNIDHKIGLDWSPLWRAPFELVAISPRQEIASVRVLDEDNGNGDGRIQQGEFVRLELEVADVDPRLLSGLRITLRNLDSGAILTESPEVFFERAGGSRNRSSRSPEFLVRTDLAVGAALDFQVTFDSGFGVHRDTIRTFVAAGGDLTPPRIEGETGMLIRRQVAEGVSLLLPESAILEPSPLSETTAVVYSTRDTTEVGRVRLDRQADGYRGVWADPPAGTYLIRILIADAAGNAAFTPLQLFEVEARSVVAETPISEDLMAELYVRSEVNAVVHSPDGQVTAVAEGVSIRLYENTGLGEVGVLYGHTGQVRSLSFSPDGSLLASGSWDATVLWDANTLEQVLVLPRHDDRVEVVTFSPDGSLLASSGWHGSIRLWELAPDASLGSVVNAVEFDSLLRRRNVGVLCLAFHPDGLSLVAGSSDGAVSLWSLGPKREVIRELHRWKLAPDASLGSVVNAVAFSNDGNWLATGGRDGTMRIHDMLHYQRENNYTPAVVIDELQGWISDLAFSPDGFSMASASRDGSVRLWGVPGFRPKGVFESGVEQVLSLSFRPDGHQLAAGSRDGRVQFWRIAPKVVEVAEGEQSVTPNSPFLAYPNPFNGGISIPFRVDTDGDVRVVIHGMAGQVVRVLEMGQLPAGDYASPSRAAFWDGVTDEGANAASGVYLLTVEAAGARTRSKIALVR